MMFQTNSNWGVKFSDGKVVSGMAACSELAGTSFGSVATDQSRVQSAYISTHPTRTPLGKHCYCAMKPLSWVYNYSDAYPEYCANQCAKNCATSFTKDSHVYDVGTY